MPINSLKITSLFSIILGSTSLSATSREEVPKELQVNEPSIATPLSSVGMASAKPAQNLSSSTVSAKKVEELLLHFDKARLSEKRKLAPEVYNVATSKEVDPTMRNKAISLMRALVDKEMRQKGEEARKLYKNELSSSSSSQNATPILVSQKNAALEPSNLNPSLQLSKKLKNNSAALTTPNVISSAKNKKVASGPNIGTPQASKDSVNHRAKSEKLLQKLGVKESPKTTRILEQCCLKHLTDGQITRLSDLFKTNPMQLKNPILIIPILAKLQINQMENLCKFGAPLITKKMNDKQKLEIIKALVETKIFTSPFIKAVISLTEDLNPGDKVNIIKALAKIGPKDLTPEFIQAITSFTNNHTSSLACQMPEDRATIIEARTAIIEALVKIGPKHLEAFKGLVVAVQPNRAAFICSLAKAGLEANFTSEFINVIPSLITSRMDDKDKRSIIEVLAKIKSEHLIAFKDLLAAVAPKNYGGHDKAAFICFLAKAGLEANFTSEFINVIPSLISSGMDDKDRRSIVEVLAKIKSEHLIAFKDLLAAVAPKNYDNYFRGQHDKAAFICSLAKAGVEANFTPEFTQSVTALTNNRNDKDRKVVIHALAEVGAEKLTPEFVNDITSLIPDNMNGQDSLSIIHILANIAPENLAYFNEIAAFFVANNMDGKDYPFVIQTLANTEPENLKLFKDAVTFLRTIRMSREGRVSVFKALVKIGSKNYTTFKNAAISLITNDSQSDGLSGSLIRDLAEVALKTDFIPEFIQAVTPLATKYKNGEDRQLVMHALASFKAGYLTLKLIQKDIFPRIAEYENAWDLQFFIRALPYIKKRPREERYEITRNGILYTKESRLREDRFPIFRDAAISLLSPDIATNDILYFLAHVPTEKQEFVYPHIQTLMNRSQVKFSRGEHMRQLVSVLRDFDQQTAETFVARVIHLVENDKTRNIRVDEQRFLTHIGTMHTQLTRVTRDDETRVLLTHRQSTHKKEAHESIAMSLKKLEKRYSDAFQICNVFEVVKAKLKSFSRRDTEDLFKSAVRNFKEIYGNLNIGPEIDKLLTINPYTRAGENDEDTLLNQDMRAFLQRFQKNQEFRKDVESLVGKYSRMKDYDNALKVISFMERESAYKNQTSGMDFAQKLSLIYAALTDRKSQKNGDEQLTEKDIEDRWRVLFTRYAKVYHEYGNSSSCTGGVFNAGVEALDGVHPDVNIIQSFRAFMQEISLEKDDDKYEQRIKIALSHLGEKAQDPYYQDEIMAWKDAREESKAFEKNEEEPHKLAVPPSSSSKDEEE